MKNAPETTDLTTRARSLRHLKWGAVLLPTLFIWWSETIRHRFFDDAPVWLGNLITASVAFIGSYIFAQIIFRLIERVDAALVTRNHRLATLYTLAALASQPTNEATLLHASLPVIRDGLGASSVMFTNEHVSEGANDTEAPPLVHDGVTLGWLVVSTENTRHDTTLYTAIIENLSVAIANRRLSAETSQIAVLEERDRIARELHDGLAQLLATITFQSERARASLADGNTQAARVAMDRIEHASSTAYADVREAIVGLRTGDTDFLAALTQTADWFSDATDITVHLDADLPSDTLPPMAELQFLRVVQESLTNIRKHASASDVWITAARDASGALQLAIRDNGVGFAPDRVPRLGRQHFGLIIIRERVESFGGILTITAAPGNGTTITATLPSTAAEARGVA